MKMCIGTSFPKWMRAVSKHYSDAVYNYAVNVIKVDASGESKTQIIEEGIAATQKIFSQYGIAATFNEITEVPEKKIILEELKEFEDDDVLTREEVKELILKCIQ